MAYSKNLFLIDDDQTYNFIHAQTIKDAPYAGINRNVKSFDNALNALEELKNLLNSDPDEIPEIIFLDINMPYMNGWEFLEEFSKFPDHVFKNCKVFILTSSIDQKDIEKSKIYIMVQDFITKPLTKGKLQTLFSNKAIMSIK